MDEDELEKYVPFTEESLLRLKEKREQLKRRNDNENTDKTSTAQQAVIKGVSLNLTPDGSDDFIMDHPDPTLEDSQELRLVCGKFPDNLHSVLLEDIDFYYTERGEETFCVVSRRFGTNNLYRFSATKSFYFLSPFHPLRKFAIRAKIHPLFDTLVMLTIIINCVFLALDDEVRSAEYVFLGMYILEMLVKMIARGVVMDKHTYLRDPWNWLDFVVVIIALATISYDANLSGLRAFRVLRAFKSVSIIPGLRTIVNAIFNSMKPLGEVMLIMIFLLVIIALIALQAYQGVLRRRCVKYPPPPLLLTAPSLNWTEYITNPENWNDAEGETAVCGNSTGSGLCPAGFICLPDVGPNPNYGHTNFDHMGYSLLTTFQLITLDYWENVYNMIIRAQGPWNVFFFLMSVVLGPFYLLNLLLAVVALAYSNEHQKQQKMEEKRARAKWHAKRKALRRRRLQEAATKNKCDCDVTSGGGGGSSENSSGENHQDACSKQAEYRERPKDLSVESSESSNTEQSYVMAQLSCFVSWFMFHFCSWACHPLFKRFQLSLQKIIQNDRFDYFIMFCIIINTICFAIDHHGITKELEDNLNLVNQIFTIIFTLEMMIKVLAFGPIRYMTDLWNLFDFSIVVISLFEFLSFLLSSDQGLPPLNILRTLRLLRVLRLARIWGTMHKLVMIIRSSICAVSYLTVVLFLILYIFAVIGKQWYGTRYEQSGSMFEDGEIPRWNFTDFYHSFLLVWRVMCGEWIEPLYDCLYITRNDNDKFCIPLFLLITVIANFMVLNLFTAILLEAFVDKLKPEKDKNSLMVRTPAEPSTTTAMLTSSTDVSRKERISVSFNLTEKVVERKSPSRRSTVVECLAIDESIDKTSLIISDVEKDDLRNFSRQSRISDDVIMIGSPAAAETPGSGTEMSSSTTTEYRASTLSYPMTSSTASLLRTNQVAPAAAAAETAVGGAVTSSEDDVRKHGDDVMLGKETINGGTNCHHYHHQHHQQQQRVTSSSVSSAGRVNDDVSTRLRHNVLRCCGCCWEQQQRKGKPIPSHDGVTAAGSSPTSGNLQQTIVELEKISHATRDDMTSSVKFSDVISQTSSSHTSSDPPSCFPNWLVKRQPKLIVNCDYLVCDVWLKTRKACYEVTQQNYFEGFILLLILASTICLAMEDINLKNDPYKKNILEKLEYVFAILFTIELVLKITGFGLIKYFTSLWCWLDFGIVVASWVGIIIQSRGEASSFRVLRTVRALRPLRAVSRWEGMKAVVNALFSCIPSIANVLCVCLLIWLVFGIMGVQFFKGKFFRCVDKEDNIVKNKDVVDKKTCLQHGYGWFNPTIHFDNVGMAVLALLQVATFEGWMEIIASASDITDIDKQPIRDHGKYNAVFFVFFVLIGSFFILNLIVGVIIESFQKLRKKTDASSAIETLMTDTQKNFYKTMRTMLNRKPKKTIPKPKAKWQLFIFNMVTHSRFELGVFFLILMNIVTLSMGHYHQTPEWSRALRFIDIIFTSVFATEAILKIIGTRHHYFRDAFNVFDLIVILVSITGFILEEILPLTVSPTLLRVVRVFRVFRVLRVVRAARGIRRLILTLFISLPALFNIAILLSVFIIIYAILGMNLFMEANNNGAINDIVNFRTFANSVMLLFRLITSAGWNDILDPLTNPRNCLADQECVDGRVAIAYFVSFIWIVFLVIVNMYIAIILENFDEILQQDKSGVSQGEFDTFYIVWGRYDPQATQFVSLDELSNLIHELHPPFQLPKPNQVKIAALELPVYKGDKVHCLDVLYALVKRKFGDVEIPEIMKKEAEMRLLKSFPNRRTLKPETTTLILRQHTRAARIIQNWYRASLDRKMTALEKNKNQPLNGADELRGKSSATAAAAASNSSSSSYLPSPPSDAGSLQLRERPCRVTVTSRSSVGTAKRLKIARREDGSRSYNNLNEENASSVADQNKMAFSKSSVDFTRYDKSHFVATSPGEPVT